MCCKNVLLKIIVLAITFGLGVVAAGYFMKDAQPVPLKNRVVDPPGYGIGSGTASGSPYGAPSVDPDALRILSKPRAKYTDAARNNNVQGTLRLSVTFLASGEIGPIKVINRLPDGLTERAIAAAQQIKFEPKKINGVPVSVVRVVEYSFSIY